MSSDQSQGSKIDDVERIIGYNIPTDGGGNGSPPNHVVWKILTLESSTAGTGDIYLKYLPPELVTKLDGQLIKDHIDKNLPHILKHIPSVDSLESQSSRKSDPSPLDFKLLGPAYVAFILDPRVNWQFDKDGSCFSLKDMRSRARYKNLTHRTASGQHQGKGSVGEECRLLYCEAMQEQDVDHVDGFNLHIELTDAGLSTKIIIDPDVTNCGTCTDDY